MESLPENLERATMAALIIYLVGIFLLSRFEERLGDKIKLANALLIACILGSVLIVSKFG
jgi:hypothetical protein